MNASTKIVKTSKVKFELLFKIAAVAYLIVLTFFSSMALKNIHFVFALFLIALEFIILSATWKAARDRKKNPIYVCVLILVAWALCSLGIKSYLDQNNEINGTITTTNYAPKIALLEGNIETLNNQIEADTSRKLNISEDINTLINGIKASNDKISNIREDISDRMLAVANCSKSTDCTKAVSGYESSIENIESEISQTEHQISTMRKEVSSLEVKIEETTAEVSALKTNLTLVEEQKISQAATTDSTGNAFIKTLKQVLTPVYEGLGLLEVTESATVMTEVSDKQAWNVLNWLFGVLSYAVYFAMLSLAFPREPKEVSAKDKFKGGVGATHSWFKDTFFETEETVEVKHPLA